MLDAFKKIRYCKTLRLKKCFNENAAFFYFKTILQNTTVDYLDLRYSLINNENVNDLVDILSNQAKLKGLNISFTQLEDSQFIVLLDYITQNRRDFQFEVNKNKLSKDVLLKLDFYKKMYSWIANTLFYDNTFTADFEDNNNCKSYCFLLNNEKDTIKEYEEAMDVLSDYYGNINMNQNNQFDFRIIKTERNNHKEKKPSVKDSSFISKLYAIHTKKLSIRNYIVWDDDNIICLCTDTGKIRGYSPEYYISFFNLTSKSCTEIIKVNGRVENLVKMNDKHLFILVEEILSFGIIN